MEHSPGNCAQGRWNMETNHWWWEAQHVTVRTGVHCLSSLTSCTTKARIKCSQPLISFQGFGRLDFQRKASLSAALAFGLHSFPITFSQFMTHNLQHMVGRCVGLFAWHHRDESTFLCIFSDLSTCSKCWEKPTWSWNYLNVLFWRLIPITWAIQSM